MFPNIPLFNYNFFESLFKVITKVNIFNKVIYRFIYSESKDGNTEKGFAERQAESWQPKPYWGGEPVDVDNDGKKEKAYYYSTAMTQSPHIAQIVKDNKVIFELEAPRINISEVPDGNGFYLGQYAGLQGTLLARYRFEDGKFIRYEIEYKK